MDPIKLSLGKKLELELYDINGDRMEPILVSQFEAPLPDGSLEVLAPIHGGEIYPVERDTVMDVTFEINGDLYRFEAVAVGRRRSGTLFLLTLKPRSNAVRIQRRTFFRFDCVMDIKYRIFEHKTTKKECRGEFKNSLTKDISGGGLCLLTSDKPQHGWYIEGVFNVGREVHFLGRIVRVITVKEKGVFDYEIGVEFMEISNREREMVISYIFDLQRKLLRKGWATR